MNLGDITNLIDKQGLGAASFVALVYGIWKILAFLERIAENHLWHVQASLDKMVDSLGSANTKLDKQTDQLEKIIDQTKK